MLCAEKISKIIQSILRAQSISDHGEKEIRSLSYHILKIFSKNTTNSNAIFLKKKKKKERSTDTLLKKSQKSLNLLKILFLLLVLCK